MAPEFLHRTDVAPRLKPVRREAVQQRARRGSLDEAGITQGSLEGSLDDLA